MSVSADVGLWSRRVTYDVRGQAPLAKKGSGPFVSRLAPDNRIVASLWKLGRVPEAGLRPSELGWLPNVSFAVWRSPIDFAGLSLAGVMLTVLMLGVAVIHFGLWPVSTEYRTVFIELLKFAGSWQSAVMHRVL